MNKKYKYTNKDIKILQKFINENIDPEITLHKNNVYECEVATKRVYVGSKKYTADTELFMKWLSSQPEFVSINYNLISILHEIGHIMTHTPKKEKERTFLYSVYSFLNEFNIMSIETLNNKYFAIADEKDATMWGLNFYKNNIDKCNKLVTEINL